MHNGGLVLLAGLTRSDTAVGTRDRREVALAVLRRDRIDLEEQEYYSAVAL